MEDPGQFGEFAAWAEEGGGGPPKLPKHLEEKRTRVTCGADRNLDTHLPTSFHTYGGVDGVYNGETIDEFKENFALKVTKAEENVLDFEMRGCGPALANGLRRTLIGEVETMAIEHVFFRNNTSIILTGRAGDTCCGSFWRHVTESTSPTTGAFVTAPGGSGWPRTPSSGPPWAWRPTRTSRGPCPSSTASR